MQNLTTEMFKTNIFDFENNEDWKYLGDIPSIVKYGTKWCLPCQQIEPILEQLSKEYEGRVNIYTVDVEEEFNLSEVFNIKSVPSLLFIPMEGEPKMLVGGIGKEKFKNLITEIFKF
jgi:thiol-disulfide isomerase/thioredoxin